MLKFGICQINEAINLLSLMQCSGREKPKRLCYISRVMSYWVLQIARLRGPFSSAARVYCKVKQGSQIYLEC